MNKNEKKLELLSPKQAELLYQVLNDSIFTLVRQFNLTDKITVADIDNHVNITMKTFNEYAAQQIVFEEIRNDDNKTKTKKTKKVDSITKKSKK